MPESMDVEGLLAELAGGVAWPGTPELRGRVRARITAVRRPWYGTRWALAAVAVLVIIATLLAYAPTRTAIADWINLHTSIRRTTALPTPSNRPSGPLGVRLGLGSPTTLEAARSSLEWRILLPSNLGQPDEVYLQLAPDAPSLGECSLVYGVRPGIPVAGATGVTVLVTEARGAVNQQFFGKIVGNGTTVEPLSVDGHAAWWISGTPHDFFFVDANGDVRHDTLRLATNTLIVDMNGTIVRIEGDLTKQQAIDTATSLA